MGDVLINCETPCNNREYLFLAVKNVIWVSSYAFLVLV